MAWGKARLLKIAKLLCRKSSNEQKTHLPPGMLNCTGQTGAPSEQKRRSLSLDHTKLMASYLDQIAGTQFFSPLCTGLAIY